MESYDYGTSLGFTVCFCYILPHHLKQHCCTTTLGGSWLLNHLSPSSAV